MIRLVIFSILGVLIMSANVFSKCPRVEVHITGTVKSEDSNAVVKDAQILVFLDQSQSTNSAGFSTKYPDFIYTDSCGTFVSTNYFDSFKKRTLLNGDVCSEKPKRLEIVVIKPGFKVKRMMYNVKELKEVEDKGIEKLMLPEIFLEK
jgi:hypothetical protein